MNTIGFMIGVQDMEEQDMSVPSAEQQNGSDLINRLRTRAAIRRNIQTRKSVQEGKPDRIADLLEEAANRIEFLEDEYKCY